MMEQCKEKLSIAMFGQKRIPSREGGVEIVVEELCTRMVAQRELQIQLLLVRCILNLAENYICLRVLRKT